GETKAVFKNLAVDLLNYETVKMFIHAETDNLPASDDSEVNAIIRLGTDFTSNYYEIEIPLKYTRNYPGGSERDVWRVENDLDISIKDLTRAKLDLQKTAAGTDGIQTVIYDGRQTIRVKGRPDLSRVRVAMLGIKNPCNGSVTGTINDEVRVWFNELRANGFNKKAGYATNFSFATNLADLGTFNASGSILTKGYGDIEQKISERAREDTYNYGVATNLQLDKLLPKKLGLQIPVYASFDKKIVKPQFDPLNPDVELQDAIDAETDAEKKERFKEKVIYEETTRSFNISNFKKVKTKEGAKKHIYDIENLSLSAGFTETTAGGLGGEDLASGNGLDLYRSLNYTGAVKYAYSPKEKSIRPFGKLKFLKGNYLKLIKDINFNPIPNTLSVSSDFNRSFVETHYLDADLKKDNSSSTYQKSFNIYRRYNLRWKPTKSINTGYTATVFSVIDDNDLAPEDSLSENTFEKNPSNRKGIDEIFKQKGRLKNFQQSVNATYKLPLNKIPLLSWLTSDVKYKAGYDWIAAPIGLDSLGNTIGNSNNISVNSSVRLSRLYNKSKLLKEISRPYRKPDPRKLKKKDVPPPPKRTFARIFIRPLMAIKSISGSLTWDRQTSAAGFRPTPEYVGLSDGEFGNAPGIPFILGSQKLDDFLIEGATNQWFSTDTSLNQPITQQDAQKWNFKASIEPYNYLSINLTMSYVQSANFSGIFRGDLNNNSPVYLNPSLGGSVSMSYITLKTAFEGNGSDNISKAFENFQEYQNILRQRYLAKNNGVAYTNRSQDVLISSFLAAYTGADPNEVRLKPTPKTPLPNWRVSYSGLSRIPSLKKKFQSISINHSYSSTYQIGNYQSSLLYNSLGPDDRLLENNISNQNILDAQADSVYNPAFIIGDVSIAEKFSPLIGITIRTKKKMTFTLNYTTSRNVALQVSNAQINEVKSKGVRIGFGYTKAGMKIPFSFRRGGVKPVLNNDITMKMDITLRDTRTIQRSLDLDDDDDSGLNTITGGNFNLQIRPNINYVVNKRMNLQLYLERTINEPKVSSSFRTSSTQFGFRLRFSLI
ncbi:MAG: cell surface protein SprA, partial [Cyclobacteriaceae bacterium]